MWNEFFPISIPITATAVCAVAGMVCSLSGRPLPASIAGGAGARPDHPIMRHSTIEVIRSTRMFAEHVE